MSTSNTSGGSTVIHSRKSGVDGNLSVTFGAGIIGAIEDVSGNEDDLASGDTVNYSVVTANSTPITVQLISSTLISTEAKAHCIAADAASGMGSVASTSFFPISGGGAFAGVEANHKVAMRHPGTVSNAHVYVSINIRNSDTTFRVRKNGAASPVVCLIPLNTPGFFEDITHTQRFIVDDDLNYVLTMSIGTGSLIVRNCGCMIQTTRRVCDQTGVHIIAG